jgi:hypothetical protein
VALRILVMIAGSELASNGDPPWAAKAIVQPQENRSAAGPAV